MLTRRRIVLGLVAVVVVGLAFTAWQVYRVQRDLTSASDAAQRLRTSIDTDDTVARTAALGDLRVSAAAAHDHSEGAWWGALTHLPVVGDDATGVRALSRSLDTVAADGVQPLADAVDDLDGISANGQIDLTKLTALQEPMRSASQAFASAHADVGDLDSSGYAGFLKTRFDDYANQVADLDRITRSATKATGVLPTVLGADGSRDYLVVFQNNAEIRATGGLPGSWAVVRAEDGRLTITQQGTAAGFDKLDDPVLPLSRGEEAVYGDQLGVYFGDANFTSDFPRAAELWKARYERDNPGTPLDGILTLDPVALSYLLRGTGPINVGDTTLSADNAVQQLLSGAYQAFPDPVAQDAYFAQVAVSLFDGITTNLTSPVELLKGLSQAVDEGRFRFASADSSVGAAVIGTGLEGALSDNDGRDPHVEVTLNDATASKMSYYLRYRTRVTSQSCSGNMQSLLGSMSLSQTLTAAQAAELPVSVTGDGVAGSPLGSQIVAVRIHSPTGGTIGSIGINGEKSSFEPQELDGREVATILAQLDGPDDIVINWEMTTAEGQTGDGSVGVTPGVLPGSKNSRFASSC